jgi:hypothetical protein
MIAGKWTDTADDGTMGRCEASTVTGLVDGYLVDETRALHVA